MINLEIRNAEYVDMASIAVCLKRKTKNETGVFRVSMRIWSEYFQHSFTCSISPHFIELIINHHEEQG
jgi:hypothetical protein